MADVYFVLQILGILGEVTIGGIGVAIYQRTKSKAGLLMGSSFFLYAIYDFVQLGRTLGTWSTTLHPFLIAIEYFIAVMLMLAGIWLLYRALD